jgi:GntR family transcriptional regulator
MQVNRNSEVPLYRQVARELADRISAGELGPSERLPTESELAEHYGVNRLTVRQALVDLQREGRVTTVQGRGSFVAEAPVRYEVSAGVEASLSRLMKARGSSVEQRLLRTVREPDADMARALGTRGRVDRYELLRLVDGSPWSLTRTWVASARFRDLGSWWPSGESLYEVLADRYGVRMRRGRRTFTAAPASSLDAEHLMVPLGSPLLVMSGVNLDGDGGPAVMVEHRFRGDRVKYVVDLG